MLERDIERYLVRKVEEAGGEVRKVKWIGRRGAPDRLVMLPNKTTWVELKAPGKKVKAHQAREHERMRKMGQRVAVIDSIDRVDFLLDPQGAIASLLEESNELLADMTFVKSPSKKYQRATLFGVCRPWTEEEQS